MTTALVYAAECLIIAAAGFILAEVAVTWWYWAKYVPRINGED